MFRKHIILLFSALSIFIAVSVISLDQIQARVPPPSSLQSVPTIEKNIGNSKTIRIPDFKNITLGNLPKVKVTSELQQQLSQILPASRIPTLGSLVSPDQYLTIGSFRPLGIDSLSLDNIAALTGTLTGKVNLGQLGDLVASQTINSLLKSIPGLDGKLLGQVTPILDLALQQFGLPTISGALSDLTVGLLSSNFPELGELSLGNLTSGLSSYALDAIPGLSELPLGDILGASSILLSDLNIVGLSKLALSQFPVNLDLVPNVRFGLVDITYGAKDQNRNNPISGGTTEAGFRAEPCTTNCAHIEVTDLVGGFYTGKQWMTSAQQVPDGYGFLGSLFGNIGPAGNHPFGDAFRVTIESLDEPSGTITLGLRFRWCQKFLFVDLGCTPYNSPPIPFLALQEKSSIFYSIPSNALVNGS